MITFLSSPKAFVGHAGKIQKNAILSWLSVHSYVEVIIYGDGEGVSEACREMGVSHVSDIACSPSGVPFFNGIVEHAKKHARNDMQCYLNCDILLTPHIANISSLITFPRYLVIGQRFDLAEGVDLTITPSWKQELTQLADKGLATLHAPTGIDYFVFPRGLWYGLLPLVIGRAGYDGALLAFCLSHDIPIIDGTCAIPAIHQFHDYGHVAGAKKEIWSGGDAANNYSLHNVKRGTPTITDAVLQLHDMALYDIAGEKNYLRTLELKLRFRWRFKLLSLVVRVLMRVIYPADISTSNRRTTTDVLDCF